MAASAFSGGGGRGSCLSGAVQGGDEPSEYHARRSEALACRLAELHPGGSGDRWAAVRTRSPVVALKEARLQAFATGGSHAPAGDPLTGKGRKGVPTFGEAAARVGGAEAVRLAPIRSTRRTAGEPWSGSCFLGSDSAPSRRVTSADVLAVLAPIWHGKAETTRRVRQPIGVDDAPAERDGRPASMRGAPFGEPD